MARRKKPSVQDIIDLRWELQPIYATWKAQQEKDEKFYSLLFDVVTGNLPDGFEAVIPNTAQTIVDLTADHASGNFPQIHIPRRKETAQAQDQSTLMERFGQGFWYRNLERAPQNILRAWAQSGALRGAIAGCLVYDPDVWPDLPVPSEHGGIESDEYKEAKEDVIALRRSAWPLRLTAIDPIDLYPDPATDGEAFTIHAYLRKVYDVMRDWPNWDRMVPGRHEPLKLTDQVEFIAYADDTYRFYGVSGDMPIPSNGKSYTKPGVVNGAQPLGRGVVAHGYGFNPYFFSWGGFGSPFGAPEHKGRGNLTLVTGLIATEARRMTHLDAIVAQQALYAFNISDYCVSTFVMCDSNSNVGGAYKFSDGIGNQAAITIIGQWLEGSQAYASTTPVLLENMNSQRVTFIGCTWAGPAAGVSCIEITTSAAYPELIGCDSFTYTNWILDSFAGRTIAGSSRITHFGEQVSSRVLTLQDTAPVMDWYDLDGTANSRKFRETANIGLLILSSRNDAQSQVKEIYRADHASGLMSFANGAKVTGGTLGLGYGTGAGGAVTQVTDATTAVTLNKLCGQITTVALTTAAGAEERFTVNNTTVVATDTISVGTTYNGAGTPAVTVLKVAANAFDIVITNLHATAALDALMVINFAVIKAVAA